MRSESGTARPRPGSLSNAPDFCQVVGVILLCVFWDVFCGDVQSTELAFDVTRSFCIETGAHECVLKFSMVFDTFFLEGFPFLAFFHFELGNLISVLNCTGRFLPLSFSSPSLPPLRLPLDLTSLYLLLQGSCCPLPLKSKLGGI